MYMYTSHGFHRCECLYKFFPVDLYCEIFCFVLLFAHPPIEVSGFYKFWSLFWCLVLISFLQFSSQYYVTNVNIQILIEGSIKNRLKV